MNRTPEEGPQNDTPSARRSTELSELEGLVEIGMKRDALRLARRLLRNPVMKAKPFNEALNAALTLAATLKPWKPVVELAYERLPKRDRPAVRLLMMGFRSGLHDHAGVLCLMPRRFTGDNALAELTFVFEAALVLDTREFLDRLAKQLPRACKTASHPVMEAKLVYSWAEYLARKGEWDQTLHALNFVQTNEIHSQNAVAGIVEVHVARALLALRHGFELIEQFKRNFDPESELTVPGNDDAIQEQAAKEFRRLQKLLEKIVPKERQKQLGIEV